MNNKDTHIQSELNEEINSLSWDIAPERDLWLDISSRIKFAERSQKHTTMHDNFDWSTLAIAACLIMACAAVLMSSMSYYRVNQTYDMQASYIEYQKAQITLMEQQHSHVRTQFVALLGGQMGNLNDATAAEIKMVLMTFDEASEMLKEAILEQPFNSKYPAKLAKTYQRELKFLNQFKEYYENDKTII